jgi:pSer/pThr/pTyr-binding forkhead associated (FHA) protein
MADDRAAGAASAAYLVDDDAGEAYQLGDMTLQIGRDPVSHLILLDPAVSRFHAEVRPTRGGYTVVSMGASGTQCNGEALLAPRPLVEGDRLGIGATTVRFTRQRPAPDVVIVPPPETDADHVPRDSEPDSLTRKATRVVRAVDPTSGPSGPDAPSAARRRRRPILLVLVGAVLGFLVTAAIVLIARH